MLSLFKRFIKHLFSHYMYILSFLGIITCGVLMLTTNLDKQDLLAIMGMLFLMLVVPSIYN